MPWSSEAGFAALTLSGLVWCAPMGRASASGSLHSEHSALPMSTCVKGRFSNSSWYCAPGAAPLRTRSAKSGPASFGIRGRAASSISPTMKASPVLFRSSVSHRWNASQARKIDWVQTRRVENSPSSFMVAWLR